MAVIFTRKRAHVINRDNFFRYPPVQCVPGTLSLGVKRPGHEVDYSFPSSAEVKE
jgi:hypothetical protein